jgi:hypothetical protein
MNMEGNIYAVCLSEKVAMPKIQQYCVLVDQYGIRNDYHCRRMRPSFRNPGTWKENTDRHITLLAREVIEFLNTGLDLQLEPGSLGENITTQGLGDLSQIPDGTFLQLGKHVILRVCKQNEPCKNLAPMHRLLIKTIHGKRGLLCAVEKGIDEMLWPGDLITVLP